MNKAFLSAQATANPEQTYIDSSRTQVKLLVRVPNVAKKVDTTLWLSIWNQIDQNRIMQTIKKGDHIFISGAKLRHDHKAKEHFLVGGNVYKIHPEEFGIVNEIILSGRCFKSIDPSDPRQFKKTDGGYIIANQTLSVNTGKTQTDLFNFFAINKVNDAYKPANLLLDFTDKGTGLTISGKLVTDFWHDKATRTDRYVTKIQLNSMTLSPKTQPSEIKPSTTLPSDTPVASLWADEPKENQGDLKQEPF